MHYMEIWALEYDPTIWIHPEIELYSIDEIF
jgi:hypothetical protein